MGNATSTTPCYIFPSPSASSKLVFWDGKTTTLPPNRTAVVAGKVMFQFPDCMVLHADSFFIGRRIPALDADEPLLPGQTYFVIPIDRLPSNYVLSPASLPGLMSPPSPSNSRSCSPRSGGARPTLMRFGDKGPFEYIKGTNGRVSIKVVPEFIQTLLNGAVDDDDAKKECRSSQEAGSGGNGGHYKLALCSTPELKRQYDKLVRTRDQVWSPKLETISENSNISFSPKLEPVWGCGTANQTKGSDIRKLR